MIEIASYVFGIFLLFKGVLAAVNFIGWINDQNK